MRALWIWLAVPLLSIGLATAGDGLVLSVAEEGAGGVRLDWVGGQPPYQIYRAPSPVGLVAPPNLIAETSAATWTDTPPAGAVFFYRVTEAVASCDGNEDCPPEQHCEGQVCVPDDPDGAACAEDAECASAHCQNGYCCMSGDCCASAGDCGAYEQPPTCADPQTCQGTRTAGACTDSVCSGQPVDDDSGCAGQLSQDCGPYPSVFCSAAAEQVPPACASTCTVDLDCDADAHCSGTTCVPDGGTGEVCELSGDCQSGFCIDDVCCTDACTGTCRACDLAASEGSCGPIPDGADPDAECGGVSCTGFYWGWSGDSCLRKADVSAAQAACGGDNACRTQAEECTAQTTPGSGAITCHSLCQDPNLSTCSGTTAGACNNVNPGTQTCGTGACTNTVPLCVNGAPQTCTPLPPSAETCNDVDDNCDGTVDNGPFTDSFEPNADCGTARFLGNIGSDQTLTFNTPTLYGAGDLDHYRIQANETDSSCACCDFFCTDEDYRARVTLSVPVGGGSYEVCASTVCGSWTSCITVTQGSSNFVQLNLDGACGAGTDSYPVYIRVRGVNPPAFECRPYTLSVFFDALVCN